MKFTNKVLLFFIFFVLFLIPFFWQMRVGGDDGKFYYIFPLEFLKNFSLENIFNDLGSFNPAQFLMPFSFTLFLFKKALFFLSMQKLFFGLNLACGFLFFYLFLGTLIKKEDREKDDTLMRITPSLFYSLSIFSYYTLWNSQLLAMYLVSIFPLMLFLFFKSIKENKIVYSVLASLVLSLFSILALSAPWLLGLILAALPIFIYFFLNNKKLFLKHSLIFISLFFLLNMYWLIGFLSSLGASPIISNASSSFNEQNISLIKAVSSHNSVLYPFFDLFHKNIQIDYNWPTKDLYLNYLLKLLPLNFIFLLIVILPAFFYKKATNEEQHIYNASLLSWLVILFLFTANIGKWGLPLFIWLASNIPGFVMFRNMYDKFGIAMSFAYALLLFISLKIIFSGLKVSEFIKNIIYSILILLVLLNSYPFILGGFYNTPIQSTENTYSIVNDFNDDFYQLTDYISNINTSSKFLWLPLNNAGYTPISDKYNKNYYYNGISLLKTLTGKNDYSGILSFNQYSSDIQKYIANNEYEKLFDLLGKFNIEYIILNKDISKELQDSYLYGYLAKSDLYFNQMSPVFLNYILGDKVKDFGNKYSLYKINEKYLSKTLDFQNIEFKKINNSHYEIQIKGLKTSQQLTFLSSYSDFWHIYLDKNPSDFICSNKSIYKIRGVEYYKISDEINSLQRSIDSADQKLVSQLVEDRSKLDGNNITECQQSRNFFIRDLRLLWEKPSFSASHKIAYDYANQWTVSPNFVKNNFDKNYYKENSDGSIDIQLTLFFKPQLYFYLGSIVSIITLFTCLIYIAWYFLKKMKHKTSCKIRLASEMR